MKIYTRSGDKGKTSLFDGSRVDKFDERINLLGEIDELNARIGDLVVALNQNELLDFKEIEFLEKLQSLLFDLGGEIANPKLSEEKYKNFSEYVLNMETYMDEIDKDLPELQNFILPGGSNESSKAHLCRTQARKTERLLINFQDTSTYSEYKNETANQFLNRLSDYFFVIARVFNKANGTNDIVWKSDKVI